MLQIIQSLLNFGEFGIFLPISFQGYKIPFKKAYVITMTPFPGPHGLMQS